MAEWFIDRCNITHVWVDVLDRCIKTAYVKNLPTEPHR